MVIKKGITKDRRNEVIDWSFEFFKHLINKPNFSYTVIQKTNWSNSAMLVDENDEILGVYLLGDTQLKSILLTDDYNNLKGVEGVLLAVDTSIRGKGWGNKLKDYPNILGFDYIWGQQFKTLNNLDDWLKRRQLIAVTNDCYITAEFYQK